jgi:hypothetical protein
MTREAQALGETPDGQKYNDLRYATTDPEKSALLSPVRVVHDALQSLPSTAAMATTVFLTRGAAVKAYGEALAAGYTKAEANAIAVQAAGRVATLAGALGEGTVGGIQQGEQTRQQVLDGEEPTSRIYNAMLKAGVSKADAKQYVATEAGNVAGGGAAVVDALTNALEGPILGKIISEGGNLPSRIIKGVLAEGTQEAVQGAGEQVSQNYAQQKYVDPKQALGDQVAENVIASFAVGGVTGGAFTGVGGVREHTAMARGADLVTPEDHSSPLPTDLIQQGKGTIAQDLDKGTLDLIDKYLPEAQGTDSSPISAPPSDSNRVTETKTMPGWRERLGNFNLDGYKAKNRRVESGGNDQAANPLSSASGRYQFTDSTWAALGGDPTKKNDPDEQERLMDKLTLGNAERLAKEGFQATDGNLYLAHFLGVKGAIGALERPNDEVSAQVQKANPFAAGWTNGQLAAWANRKMGGKPGAWSGNPNRSADRAFAEKDKAADGEELTFTEQAVPEEEAPVEEQAASAPFDAEEFDRKRNETIEASKAAGNQHLSDLEPAVETMRGKPIFYAHDPKVTGVVRTVANTGEVVVHWNDDYSAKKELATERTEGKKTVQESWLQPHDLKDYVVGTPPSSEARTEAAPTPQLSKQDQLKADLAARREIAAQATKSPSRPRRRRRPETTRRATSAFTASTLPSRRRRALSAAAPRRTEPNGRLRCRTTTAMRSARSAPITSRSTSMSGRSPRASACGSSTSTTPTRADSTSTRRCSAMRRRKRRRRLTMPRSTTGAGRIVAAALPKCRCPSSSNGSARSRPRQPASNCQAGDREFAKQDGLAVVDANMQVNRKYSREEQEAFRTGVGRRRSPVWLEEPSRRPRARPGNRRGRAPTPIYTAGRKAMSEELAKREKAHAAGRQKPVLTRLIPGNHR